MIYFAFDKDGGFLVGDASCDVTAYAYPTSPNATKAKKNAKKVAQEMVANQKFSIPAVIRVPFNNLVWSRLSALVL